MTPLKLSFAQHYHERTKYSPENIAAQARSLDFAAQPVPYKQYPLGALIDLQPYLAGAAESEAKQDPVGDRLSRLLINTYGLTARVPSVDGEPFYLRAAPSAGGLYPAEIYLISRGTSLLPAGLYNYQVRSHGLVRFWDEHVWQSLQKACFWHPALEQTHLAMIVTAVFFRSAWRYEDRAYRRIFLDTGHLLGNLELAGALTDYRPHLIGGFADSAVNQMLYLDEQKEGAIAVIALADLLQVEQNLPADHTTLASDVHQVYPALAAGELLPYLHAVSQIPVAGASKADPQPRLAEPAAQPEQKDKYNFPFCLKASTTTSPLDWGDSLHKLENTILRRRSTRRYSGLELKLADLKSLLHFAYQPQDYVDQGCDRQPDYFDLSLIETFVAVSSVVGLDEGCYYYAPQAQELRQIRFKNFRRELHYLCLGQDLGRDAAAVLFHTADLNQAVARYGDRAYRYLHMDAGHLGQKLNLAAIRLNLGVSGIAGFFDDQVNKMLGIPDDEAVLYITTFGQPRQRR